MDEEVTHVSMLGEKYTINPNTQDCSCRRWLINVTPYYHSLTTMKFLNLNGEEYISHWFRRSTYEKIYNSIIFPMNEQLLWSKTSFPNLLPPRKRTFHRRPKEKRRLEPWELKKDDTQLKKGVQRKSATIVVNLVTTKNIVHNSL